jgi:hypothetical protein
VTSTGIQATSLTTVRKDGGLLEAPARCLVDGLTLAFDWRAVAPPASYDEPCFRRGLQTPRTRPSCRQSATALLWFCGLAKYLAKTKPTHDQAREGDET